MYWGCISGRTQRHNPGGAADFKHWCAGCSGLSGCWFHSWKTQTISHTNTLRPMLIPEQAKSTWQPIKSCELCGSFAFQWYCLWCAGECLYWPVFQMSHSRNTQAPSESSLLCHRHCLWSRPKKSREHGVTERGSYGLGEVESLPGLW